MAVQNNSLIYKIFFFVGQAIVLISIIIMAIFATITIYEFILSSKNFAFFIMFMNDLNQYWLNPNWLNPNQGVLAMIQIVLSILPIILYLFSKYLAL
jgi:hypothetical protein